MLDRMREANFQEAAMWKVELGKYLIELGRRISRPIIGRRRWRKAENDQHWEERLKRAVGLAR